MTAPPTPAPPSRTIPIVTDAVRLVRVLFSPGSVFAEQQDRPTFWGPWLVVSVAFVCLQVLQRPFQNRVREILIEQAGRQVPAGGGAVGIVLGLVFGAITVLVMAALVAGILYLLLTAFGGEATYKKMLTVSIFVWPVVVIQQLLTFVVLSMRGLDSIHGVWDMFVSFGADLLLPSDAGVGTFLRLFLAGIGPLAIWQVAISAVGLTVLGKAGKGAAWGAATVAYLIGLVLSAGLGSFGMKMAGG
jgi:hypothetical protein